MQGWARPRKQKRQTISMIPLEVAQAGRAPAPHQQAAEPKLTFQGSNV